MSLLVHHEAGNRDDQPSSKDKEPLEYCAADGHYHIGQTRRGDRIRSDETLGDRILRLLGVTKPVFDPEHRFVTSYVLSPLGLGIWRALVAVFAFISLVINGIRTGGHAIFYYTVLSYLGLTVWFIVSAIHTLSFAVALRRYKAATSKTRQVGAITLPTSTLERLPATLKVMHTLLTSTVPPFAIVVTAVFWKVLAGPKSLEPGAEAYSNISEHALNLAVSILDTLLSRTPMRPWWHLLSNVVIVALYLAYGTVVHAHTGFWPYSFLNEAYVGKAGKAIACIGIAIATVFAFLMIQFIIFLREWSAAKVSHETKAGWGTAKAVGVPDDALWPSTRGPGPEGEGGSRSLP